MRLRNLIAATYTPMNEDRSLNLDVIGSYGAYLSRNKVTAAFINGSTGDFASLTVAERKSIVDTWATNKPADFKLINHVGHTSLKVSKDLTHHSKEKVDAIATLAPFYFKVDSIESLLYYCKEIAACAPQLPFYYYHIPVLTGANLKMSDFIKIAVEEIPNFAGLKFTKNDLIDFKYCKDIASDRLDVLFGVDEMFLPSLSMGAMGWVGSTYNHLAPLYYKIKDAFERNDTETAATLQTKAIRFVDILNGKGGFNGVAKGYMKTLGIDCGPSRFPHTTLLENAYEEINKELEAIGLLPYTNT